jgi:Fur family peroxide stress response transcriptional regulator
MNSNYIDVLHQAGLRATPQRIAICEFMAGTDSHPTSNDIYEQLKIHYPSLSFATIYNTLDVLVGMGFVNVLGSIGDDKVHFDSNTSPHVNLACIKCHKIVDMQSDIVGQLDSEINQKSGYRVLGTRVLYYGICPQCQSTD